MRYGILSDIHGNLEALEAVLDLCRYEAIDQYLSTGDIVGYGANPKECLKLVQDIKAICVAGNHDWAASGKLNPIHFNPVAKESVAWTQAQFSDDNMDYFNNLDLIHRNSDLIMVHGTLSEPEYFHYLIYNSQAVETFHLMDRPICFIGHTHAPQIIIQENDEALCLDEVKIKVQPDHQYIVNAGSIGQPRDGNPMAAYCVYDTDSGMVEIKRVPYDIESAQKKILNAGLPEQLAERLALGQ